jgi:putative ABC transport system substrate-binding protein
MPTRRDALLALSALSAARLAHAQAPKPGKPKRIGDLNTTPGPERSDPDKPIQGEEPFWDELRKRGWVLGVNVVIERAYANGKLDRLAGLAEELVRKRVDVVLTDGQEASVAAARATRDIPILFQSGSAWPVELGLIDSFAKPGRNVTGFTDH